MQQQLATAIANEFRAIADYNTALAPSSSRRGRSRSTTTSPSAKGRCRRGCRRRPPTTFASGRKPPSSSASATWRRHRPAKADRAARRLGRRLERGSSTTCRHSLAGRRRNPRCSRRQSRSTRRTRRRNRCRRAIARSARQRGRPLRPCRPRQRSRAWPRRHRERDYFQPSGTATVPTRAMLAPETLTTSPIGSGLDSLPVPPVAASSAMPPLTTPAAPIGDFGAGRSPADHPDPDRIALNDQWRPLNERTNSRITRNRGERSPRQERMRWTGAKSGYAETKKGPAANRRTVAHSVR